MNNKLLWGIVILVVIVGGIYLVTRNGSTSSSLNNGDESGLNDTGRVVFAVTDAAANMGQISQVNIKISRVDIHSLESGWISASVTPKTYDLLALNANNESRLLADVSENAGTYDQIRLVIDSVNVKTKAGTTLNASVPSSDFVINTNLIVGANSTSTASFDFIADKSLFTTTSGAYVFAPVVETEIRSNAGISISADGVVLIAGGTIENTNSTGMDVDGTVKLNFELNSLQRLNIEGNSIIKLDTLTK